MSFVGNRGTFTRGYKAMIMDVEFLYHLLYLIICSLGVFVHVFFYSLLVSTRFHSLYQTSVFHTWTFLLTLTSDLSHFHRHVYRIHYLFLLSLQLFDLIYREETLLNVIKSVTRNGRSIVLTAVLALILVYLFSIVGYIIFKDDFILTVDRISNKTLGENNRWISLRCCPKLCLKMKLCSPNCAWEIPCFMQHIELQTSN